MKLVGLTGGIASGKSTVSAMLVQHGFPIVDADLIAHEVILPGTGTHRAIVDAFGTEILEDPTNRNSSIVRKKLGAVIFGKDEERHKLNAITHSAIRREMFKQIFMLFLQGHQVVILDVPLLIETKMDRMCSKVIVVYVDDETQTSRLLKRDGSEREYAQNQINSQMPLKQKCKHAQWVIDNSGSKEGTRRQVAEIAKELQPSVLAKVFSARNVIFAMLAVTLTVLTRQMFLTARL